MIGAGGVGGYLGARLAAGGQHVSFVARGDHGRAMATDGLQVRSVLGDVRLRDVHVTDDARDIGPCDVVLFTVKSYDTEQAARTHLPPLLGDDTPVVTLQNGVGNLERIATIVGTRHAVGGLALIFSSITAPGVIEHTGGPGRIVVGERDGRDTARLRRLRDACEAAGIDAHLAADIEAAMWDKLAFICAQAGTTAAVRLPLGEIRDAPHAWELFAALARETYAVARAEGVRVADDALDAAVRQAEKLPPGSLSSLYHDLVAGRRLELDALHGEVLQRADRHGIEVPMTRAVHAILEPWGLHNERHRVR